MLATIAALALFCYPCGVSMAIDGLSIPIRFSYQGGTRWERRHPQVFASEPRPWYFSHWVRIGVKWMTPLTSYQPRAIFV
jgi:hypothetical protein